MLNITQNQINNVIAAYRNRVHDTIARAKTHKTEFSTVDYSGKTVNCKLDIADLDVCAYIGVCVYEDGKLVRENVAPTVTDHSSYARPEDPKGLLALKEEIEAGDIVLEFINNEFDRQDKENTLTPEQEEEILNFFNPFAECTK